MHRIFSWWYWMSPKNTSKMIMMIQDVKKNVSKWLWWYRMSSKNASKIFMMIEDVFKEWIKNEMIMIIQNFNKQYIKNDNDVTECLRIVHQNWSWWYKMSPKNVLKMIMMIQNVSKDYFKNNQVCQEGIRNDTHDTGFQKRMNQKLS